MNRGLNKFMLSPLPSIQLNLTDLERKRREWLPLIINLSTKIHSNFPTQIISFISAFQFIQNILWFC